MFLNLKNRQLIVGTALGVIIALIFDDLRKLFFQEFLSKILDHYFIKEKKIEIFGARINTQRVIDLSLTIFLSVIVVILMDNYLY